MKSEVISIKIHLGSTCGYVTSKHQSRANFKRYVFKGSTFVTADSLKGSMPFLAQF